MKSDIDQLITDYIQKPNPIEGMETIITHITSMQSMSKKDKLKIFNTISNYHWIDYQDSKKGKGIRTTLQGTAAIYYGFLKTEIEEITCQLLQGCNLCNSTCLKKSTKNCIGPLVTQLVQRDKGEEITDYVPPLKRRKKTKHTSAHIV